MGSRVASRCVPLRGGSCDARRSQMSRFLLFVGAFVLALAASLWATVSISRSPIEKDLTRRTLDALADIDGFRPEFCDVAFVGRDGRVTGEVQSDELKQKAQARLADLYGARVIESDLVVRPFDAPWIMVERQEEGGVRVEGLLAETAERDAVAKGLSESIGGASVDLDVEVREKVEPATWLPRWLAIAGELVPQADGARATLRDGKLSLAGELPDGDARDALAASAAKAFDAVGVELEFALTVAPPPEPAYFEMSPPDGDQIVVAGRFAELETAEKLLSLLRSSGDWIVKDQIVVAENTTPAPWVDGLTLLLPSMLGEVIGAGLKVDGATVRLDGQVEEGMFEAIGELAQQNFPADEFDLQNRLKLMTPPREAMVSVITFPDEPVRLKGLLADAELKQQVVQAVRGAIGGRELLTDELQVDPNVLEANWIDALVGLIPPYVKQVERGGLTIFSNILAVDAVIDSEADRDLIWAMTEQYFPDESYRRLLELRFPEEVGGGIASDDDSQGGE